jgi:serine O-acetyltransferase
MPKLLKMAQKPHRNGKGRAMLGKLRSDLKAIMERDPAAQGVFAAVFLYPSFHVLLFHRIAHPLWRWHFKFIARAIMLFARLLTGIEIHPQAKIGAGLFIDHGMGVVIGQTATVGENVTLYHGVTLGGVNPAENSDTQRDVKRHPTIGDNVIIGAGAQILGPVTIHKCARVGGNSVVTKDVGEGITVVGIPAKPVARRRANERFTAYAVSDMTATDQTEKTLSWMSQQIIQMQEQIEVLQKRQTVNPSSDLHETGSDNTPNISELENK